ncbi:MAG: DUF3604 domain-containing protein [Candidatus Acidiferrales bacterium]
MPKFDVTKLSTATKERSRSRLALSGALAIALAAGLAIMVRSEVRAADAKRHTASSNPHPKAARSSAIPARVAQNPEREAYFGETHVHTSWSFDAYVFGNTKAGPEDAYKYAMGESIDHPAGYKVKITRPLDFMAVTDHAEYIGVVPLANDPNSPISKLPIAEKLKVRSKDDILRVYMFLGTSLIKSEPIHELVSPEIAGSVWKDVVAVADKYYQPGKFTTFAAYEWTSAPDNRNLHRNIIFKDSKKVPGAPFSALDSDHPEDLWNWMDTQRKAGNELLAISHNANLSDGIMFPLEVDSKGRPIDAAWAQERVNNEPLTEIHQLKGTSETHPMLSPNDEFADYELLTYLLGGVERIPKVHGSYIREAWQNGLAMQDSRGYNPYKMGVVGASDSHNTASGYSQSDYFGGHGLLDATPEIRLSGKKEQGLNVGLLSTAGLGGVWAEENTRESIFAAMQRKETFGTSGVRIKVRLFGGWNFRSDILDQKDWVKTGYANGVPMGGDLPKKAGKEPTFIVWAVKDPDDGNLDRIQIVKGWTKGGQIFEKIYDVAWSGNRKPDLATGKVPPVGNTVDVKNASYTNTIGDVELKKVWKDPDFDPSLHAFYYARVLQIPTPRWTTYDAKKLGVPPPNWVAPTVQERAWTSPIWYSPSVEAGRGEKKGMTVAELQSKGAVALDDAQLTALIVGKTVTVRNRVTGDRYEILYGKDGRRLITSVNGKQPEPEEIGDVLHSGALGSPAQYEIADGRLVTTLEMTPFAITVYKLGDKYVAARSNEFGYANYEVEEVK